MALREWVGDRVFRWIHGNHLVYNACWEDPRLDRAALRLSADDRVLVITSAGCNALDYALAGAKQVVAVDVNPRQTALLELKLAAVRALEYEDFFSMFGEGRLDRAGRVYADKLRDRLSPASQAHWDRDIGLFEAGNVRPFYFRGTCGTFALLMNFYIDRVARVRPAVEALLGAASLAEQRRVYEDLHDRFWGRTTKFVVDRDSAMAMLGVPPAQRRQIERGYAGGLGQFVHDCVEAVFARLPLADNYFWRVYLAGRYTRDCCPEYLKPENAMLLKHGLADRVAPHTDTVQGYLEKHETPLSRFVLLDHMDWLADRLAPRLEREWAWIVRRAAPGSRVLWRSGGLETDFVDRVRLDGGRELGDVLRYDRALAAELHAQCRVHTYGSFHIADLAA